MDEGRIETTTGMCCCINEVFDEKAECQGCCICSSLFWCIGTVKELIFTSDLSKSSYAALVYAPLRSVLDVCRRHTAPSIGVPRYASFLHLA